MIRLSAIAGSVVASLGCVIGCAGGGSGPVTPEPMPWQQPDLERPIVEGNQEGLELRVWAVEDQDALIAELIENYKGRPTPMLDSERTAWRGSGLWPISVPIDELTLARGRMRLIGVEQQDWLGLMPTWREVVPGRRVEAGAMIARPGGVLRAPAGRFRMLARCWSVPGSEGPELQVEMAVQLQRVDQRPTTHDLAIDASRPMLEQGEVFGELTSGFLMRPGEALVIVPIEPGFDPELEAEAAAPDAGPPMPAVPTVGEAMLTSVELGGVTPVRRRAIIVLIARLPSEFRLLSVSGGDESWR